MKAKIYRNLISKISEDKAYWTTCNALLALKPGYNDNSIKFLSQINVPLADVIKQCLDIWTQFYIPNIERMSASSSANKRAVCKDSTAFLCLPFLE